MQNQMYFDCLLQVPQHIVVQYDLRPDLFAADLYGDAHLWWVFAARNPNTLYDPLWDFTAGTPIYLPKKSTLQVALGV